MECLCNSYSTETKIVLSTKFQKVMAKKVTGIDCLLVIVMKCRHDTGTEIFVSVRRLHHADRWADGGIDHIALAINSPR